MQAPWKPHEVPSRPHAGPIDAPSARSPLKFPLRTLGGQVSKRQGRSPFTLALVEFVRFFLSGVVDRFFFWLLLTWCACGVQLIKAD